MFKAAAETTVKTAVKTTVKEAAKTTLKSVLEAARSICYRARHCRGELLDCLEAAEIFRASRVGGIRGLVTVAASHLLKVLDFARYSGFGACGSRPLPRPLRPAKPFEFSTVKAALVTPSSGPTTFSD